MKAVVYDPGSGRILYEVEGSATQVVAQEVEGETAIAEGTGAGGTHWVSDGEIAPRPVTGLPETAEAAVATPWTAPGIPEGAALLVDGIALGPVPTSGLVLRFDQPGEYLVEIRPPFPWLGAVCAVTVR